MKKCLTFLVCALAAVLCAQDAKIDAAPAAEMVLNGNFATNGKNNHPANWLFWQYPDSKGTAAWIQGEKAGFDDNYAVTMKGVRDGCLLQNIKIVPGKKYIVKGLCKKEGEGEPQLLVAWKLPNRKWGFRRVNRRLKFTKDMQNGWFAAEATVTAPKGAGFLVIEAVALNQGATGVYTFDNFSVTEVK